MELYIVLFDAESSQDNMISQEKTSFKIKEVLANILEIFDNVVKSFEITKHSSRENKLKSLLAFINRKHYESILFRAGTLSLLRFLISACGSNTLEIFKSFLFNPASKVERNLSDILLP